MRVIARLSVLAALIACDAPPAGWERGDDWDVPGPGAACDTDADADADTDTGSGQGSGTCDDPFVAVVGEQGGDTTQGSAGYQGSCDFGDSGPEQVWLFTGTGDAWVEVVMDTNLGDPFECSLFARETCEDDATELGCESDWDDADGVCSVAIPVATGQQYYLFADSNDAADPGGPFTLTITDLSILGVFCDSPPQTCEDIGPDGDAQWFGCCHDNVLYYCYEENSEMIFAAADCGGQLCAYDAQGDYMNCI